MTVPSSVHINLRLYSKPRILFEQFVQKQGQTVKRTEVIDTNETDIRQTEIRQSNEETGLTGKQRESPQ